MRLPDISMFKWIAGTASVSILMLRYLPVAYGAGVDCMDTATALEYWRPIREQPTTSEVPADKLAAELVSCLGSPDKELRDRIGYELFTHWLRDEKLSDETRRTLLGELTAVMAVPPRAMPDDSTFGRSFSALVLSEIMRSDTNRKFMTPEERQTLLTQAIQSLKQENDYRGLDAELGWVHPVAHISDLLWRFALHPETTAAQAESILDGVRNKVAPAGIFYNFNESDRLARVVTTTLQRGLIDSDFAISWIRSFEAPSSMDKWSEAFMSPAGMAELHNTKLFLRALAEQLNGTDTVPRFTEALETLLQGFTQLV